MGGISASQVSKITGKGKGYVINIRYLAEEHGFIEKLSGDKKLFKRTNREMPPYPEVLFPFIDKRKVSFIVRKIQCGW